MLRKYLAEKGWYIAEESVLRDGRFLYTVMSARWNPSNSKLTVGECYFSPALLKNQGSVVAEYYKSILFRLQRAINGQKDSAGPDMITAYHELKNLESSYSWLKE